MTHSYTIAQLAEIVGGKHRGGAGGVITGVGDVREAQSHQAAWVSRDSFVDALKESHAGVVLVPKDFGETPMPAILCPRIDAAIAKLLGAFAPLIARTSPGVHPSAVVDRTVNIGAGCSIGPNVVVEADVHLGDRTILHAGVYIGPGTRIGEDCEIWPNAVIRHGCILGSRVSVHSCTVIGREGFGFYFDGAQYVRIPHIGGVILEDDVEIGACACVDRAKFGNTIVGRGTKIDNHVQVAHNCRLGQYNVVAGHTGLSGSVRLGNYCVMGARVTFFDNLSIGNQVQLGGMSVVTKNLPDGLKASGHPAQDVKQDFRERASLRRVPAMNEKVMELVKRVERLEASAHNTA